MTKIVATLLLFFGFAGSASACATLGEQLAHDEPVVKAKLSALKPGERLAGINLCDNSSILGGWQFIRHAKIQGAFQHVLLFRDGRATRAVGVYRARPTLPASSQSPRLQLQPCSLHPQL